MFLRFVLRQVQIIKIGCLFCSRLETNLFHVVFLMFQALNINVPWICFTVPGSKRQLIENYYLLVFRLKMLIARCLFNLSGSKHCAYVFLYRFQAQSVNLSVSSS